MDLVKNLIEFVTSFGDSTQGSPDESTAADVHYKSRKRKRNRVRSPSSGHARDDRVQSSPSRSLMSVPPATDQSTDRVQKRLRISDDQDDLTISDTEDEKSPGDRSKSTCAPRVPVSTKTSPSRGDRNNETRLLGGSQDTPPDAMTIVDPMMTKKSNAPFTSRQYGTAAATGLPGYRKPQLHGPRAFNSLDAPPKAGPPVTRSGFIEEHKHRRTGPILPTEIPSDVHANNHILPNKRIKTQGAAVSRESARTNRHGRKPPEIIDLDADEDDDHEGRSSQTTVATKTGVSSIHQRVHYHSTSRGSNTDGAKDSPDITSKFFSPSGGQADQPGATGQSDRGISPQSISGMQSASSTTARKRSASPASRAKNMSAFFPLQGNAPKTKTLRSTSPSRSKARTTSPSSESSDELQKHEGAMKGVKSHLTQPMRVNERRRLLAGELIEGNPDSTQVRPKQNKYATTSTTSVLQFDVHQITARELVSTPDDFFIFVIDPLVKEFWVSPREPKISDEPIMRRRAISEIMGLIQCESGSTFGLLRLRGQNERMALHFASERQAYDWVRALQHVEPSLNVIGKDANWMTNAFRTTQLDNAKIWSEKKPSKDDQHVRISPGLVDDLPEARRHRQRVITQKPLRVQDRLDAPTRNGKIVFTSQEKVKHFESIGARSNDAAKFDATIFQDPATSGKAHQEESKIESRPRRETRQNKLAVARTPTPPPFKFSKTGQLGEPWQTPLVYPPEGKKQASVDFASLERLDDDEFLNDTLITFFLRYIQHKAEEKRPDLMRKMHFFNSYFLDTLMKETKGRNAINFEAVSKWTKNIDLFSRDFVVVPVNENYHWYVLIICNLPRLKRMAQGASFDDEPNEDVGFASDGLNEDTRETQESFRDLTLDEATTETEQAKPSPANKKGRKKKRPPLPKHNAKETRIIALDSLNLPRSQTSGLLKQYIIEEGKSKHSLEIDKGQIPASRVPNLPEQKNFSDCGLFLCMYLEQFMNDPYGFTAKVLEKHNYPWPEQIGGSDLRNRMRSLILELHRDQVSQEGQELIPELGRILIDPELRKAPVPRVEVVPDSPVLESTRRRSSLEARPDKLDALSLPHPKIAALSSTEASSVDRHQTARTSAGKRSYEQLSKYDRMEKPIELDDDDEPVEACRPNKRAREETVDDPQGLAEKLKAKTDVAEKRRRRSVSVSTDFLSGGRAYQREEPQHRHESPEALPRRTPEPEVEEEHAQDRASQQSEIPETQEDASNDDDDQIPQEELQSASAARAGEREMLL